MTFLDSGGNKHASIIINQQGDLAIVFEAPGQAASEPMPCGDGAIEWIDTLGIDDRLAGLFLVSRTKRQAGKNKTPMRELRSGWLRCYNEIKAFTPNVKRILLICQTELINKILFIGVKDMEEVHGTIFTLPCGLEVVPTFHDRLAHIAPWMDSDARRFATLRKPAGPLPYVTEQGPPLSAEHVIIDLETNYPINDRITSMGLQWSDDERSIITQDFEYHWQRLADMMRRGTHMWMHNMQYDIGFATNEFIAVAVDTCRAHCTLVRARSSGEIVANLKHLTSLYTDSPGNYAWHDGIGKEHDFNDPAYLCEDIYGTWHLAKRWRDYNPLVVQLFDQVVIMAAEQGKIGSKIDVEQLSTLAVRGKEHAKVLFDELVARYGVDPGKIDQLAPVLIKMGYPIKKNKTTGKYTLVAKDLDNFGLEDIKLWRQATKLDNSFVSKLHGMLRDDGTVKHRQNMLAAETGRSTMTESIWQTAPRKGPIRSLLISRWRGGKVWYIDLAQNEIRTGVYLSNDERMGKWAKMNDGHRVTASRAFNKEMGDVTEDERDATKTLLFRKMYMGQAYTQIQKIVERYLESEFSDFFGWADAVGNECMHTLQVTDAWGKTRRLHKVLAYKGKYAVKRAGGNSPIQGLASHFALWLTLRVWKKFRKLGMRSLVLFGVHDAMVGDMYPGEEELVIRCVKEAFVELGRILVKQFPFASWLALEGELVFGNSWGQCCSKDYKSTKHKCSTLEA